MKSYKYRPHIIDIIHYIFMAKNKLSILLIKKDTPEHLVVKGHEGVHYEDIAGCRFYYRNSWTNHPKWLETFFNNQLLCADRLRSSSAAGVLLVNREYEEGIRTFAVCFGYGRSLLMPACIEERFGLISTLNTVNPKGLRSVDINRLDSSSLKNRIQSPKLSEVSDFEFDVEKSLLRQATGKAATEDMGKTVSGSDSLSITVEADIDSIGDVLDRCYYHYTSSTYREAFSWIDHIRPLKKGVKVDALNSILLDKLTADEENDTWLAVPDIIDWENIVTLKFEADGLEHDDILMEDFRQEVIVGRELSLPFLKNNHVSAYDANGNFVRRWSYYKCIYSEINLENNLYILNAGDWYQVDTDYKANVYNTYQNTPISDIPAIDYNHVDEGAYNIALAASQPNYHLMDKVMIPTGMTQNNLEFCDVYDTRGKMIHVKKYGGSQMIGHLFNQGQVSASMLFDTNFRNEVNNRLPEGITIPMDGFSPSKYEVVYAVISKYQDERPHIPFFSMVVFHDVYHRLASFGYSVSLKAIRNLR